MLSCVIGLCLLSQSIGAAEAKEINYGKWKISYNDKTKSLDYSYNGQAVLSNVSVRAKFVNDTINSSDYKTVALKKETVVDKFGNGEKYTFTYLLETIKIWIVWD